MAKKDGFRSKVIAKIKGDEAEVTAVTIEKKSKAALNSQVAALSAEKVDAEIKLDDAEGALEDAKYPGKVLTSEAYLEGLRRAIANVEAAQEVVDEIDESIASYEELIAELFGEVAE
jgi:phage I-like protein